MWDNLFGKIATALAVPAMAGVWYVADATGIRPATKNELRMESWYQKRDRLLDRVEDGTITPFQRGVLSGLCMAMNIKQSDCEKREQ